MIALSQRDGYQAEVFRFKDRRHAGKVLSENLAHFKNTPNVLVLALPRGGVPVAEQIAKALHKPFDVFMVRKLGVPYHEELAMGAVASGGGRFLKWDTISEFGIDSSEIERVAAKETQELQRREHVYRHGLPPQQVRGKTIILVDDGLATGSSMHVAIHALRRLGPKKIIAAVPVAPPAAIRDLHADADEVVCACMPEPFGSVGFWYEHFDQVSDDEVVTLLKDRVAQV